MAIRPGAFNTLGEDDGTGGNATIVLFSRLSVLLLGRCSGNEGNIKRKKGGEGGLLGEKVKRCL